MAWLRGAHRIRYCGCRLTAIDGCLGELRVYKQTEKKQFFTLLEHDYNVRALSRICAELCSVGATVNLVLKFSATFFQLDFGL